MTIITILTRHPEELESYYGFGFRELDHGRTQWGDHAALAIGPEEHAKWQALRLMSGLHGARIMADASELDEWKLDNGYVSSYVLEGKQ